MLWFGVRVNYNVVRHCELHMQHCCDLLIMCIRLLVEAGMNFHHNSLERVLVTMPVIPNNPSSEPSECATEVQSIQVCGCIVVVVPPASLVRFCTAAVLVPVVVPIPRAESCAVMKAERIT